MSLLSLLKLGSSLARVKDTSSFHLAKKNLLPTFGAGNPAEAQPPVRVSTPGNPFGATSQAELSLDKVKVVRNDLSEADFEIVPKAPAGTTVPAKRYVRPNAQPDELGKKAWGMLGARLFGAQVKH